MGDWGIEGGKWDFYQGTIHARVDVEVHSKVGVKMIESGIQKCARDVLHGYATNHAVVEVH